MPTLNAALHALYAQDDPTLVYEQRVDVRAVDVDYAPYVTYQTETLRLQFPKECIRVRRFRSPYPCKIVTYRMLGMMQEREVRAEDEVVVEPDTVCIIYTRSKQDFVISFEMMLSKKAKSRF